MDTTETNIAHLYRRAAFGATPAELADGADRGYGATVDSLMDLTAADRGADAVPLPALSDPVVIRAGDTAARAALQKQLRAEDTALQLWWLQRMVASTNPLREKLALLWHGQFATSVQKVRFPKLMYGQNEIFRTIGGGSFVTLTQEVAKDPAMLIWLDAGTDKASHPNENFARELMERFTMGIGSYTEEDVRQAARCFTGWIYDPRSGGWAIQEAQHDNGTKTFLGQAGDFGGEDVIDIVTASAASHHFVVANLWSHLAYPVETNDPVVADLVPGYANDLSVTNLVRSILLHPMFTSEQARTGLIKQPIELVVGTLRALGLEASLPGIGAVLTGLGQIPFAPPNVGGWPQNGYWLSTASSLTRWRFANEAAVAAERAATASFATLADAPPRGRLDALAELLSVSSWSEQSASALSQAARSPVGLLALGLLSPEYVSN